MNAVVVYVCVCLLLAFKWIASLFFYYTQSKRLPKKKKDSLCYLIGVKKLTFFFALISFISHFSSS